jgi:hypothetical protein
MNEPKRIRKYVQPLCFKKNNSSQLNEIANNINNLNMNNNVFHGLPIVPVPVPIPMGYHMGNNGIPVHMVNNGIPIHMVNNGIPVNMVKHGIPFHMVNNGIPVYGGYPMSIPVNVSVGETSYKIFYDTQINELYDHVWNTARIRLVHGHIMNNSAYDKDNHFILFENANFKICCKHFANTYNKVYLFLPSFHGNDKVYRKFQNIQYGEKF